MNQLQNLPVEKLSLLLSVPFKEIMIKHSYCLKSKSMSENRREMQQWKGFTVEFYKKRIRITGRENFNRSYFIVIDNESGIISGSFYPFICFDIKYKEILELQKLAVFL